MKRFLLLAILGLLWIGCKTEQHEPQVHPEAFPVIDYTQPYESLFWLEIRSPDSLYIDISKHPPDTMWRFQYEYKREGVNFIYKGKRHLSKNIIKTYVPKEIMNSTRTGLKP